MKNKLYIVMISEECVRDAQVLDFDKIPDAIDANDMDVVSDYAARHDECWVDCFGSVFVDVVRAASDEDAVDFVAKMNGYNKNVLSSICVES